MKLSKMFLSLSVGLICVLMTTVSAERVYAEDSDSPLTAVADVVDSVGGVAEKTGKAVDETLSAVTGGVLPLGDDEAAEPEGPAIEPEADEALKKMSEFLKTVEAFTLKAEIVDDAVLDTGQKLQFDASVEANIRKPDRIHAAIGGGMNEKAVWYDGKTITILDPKSNHYASVDVSDNIDDALTEAADSYGLNAPLSDFALADPYESLMANTQTGIYVGQHAVVGVACHHLAFTQESIDWQIWIAVDEDKPLPRKLVITYKNVPGSPQYMAFFKEWDLKADLDDDLFVFEAPEESAKIDFLPLKGLPGGQTISQGEVEGEVQ